MPGPELASAQSYALVEMPSEDAVRQATRARIERRWPQGEDTLIVDEMGTHFGAARIDIAVVNGSLRGYELKSASDRLGRLPGQVEAFSEVFDYMTIVAAERHLAGSEAIVPAWWGIVEAVAAGDGLVLKERRKAKRNPAPLPTAVASLLWRSELLGLLEGIGADRGVRSADRPRLIAQLVAHMSMPELGVAVRKTIRARQEWRVDPARKPSDARCSPARTSSGFLARRLR